MAFIPQNDFERSLMTASTDASHRPQFYRDLMQAEFFVIQEGEPPAQTAMRVAQEGQSIRVRSIDWNGMSYIPVFSSLDRLESALTGPAGYIAMRAVEFMKITKGANLLLNPGADYAKELPAKEIDSILNGSIWEPSNPWRVEESQDVLIGQPASYPTELIAALTRYLSTQKSVSRAFLAQIFHPKHDEKPHTLIAIEVDGDCDRIVAEAGMVISNVIVPDPPVDMIRMTGEAGIEDYFRGEVKPFYRRKWFGIF